MEKSLRDHDILLLTGGVSMGDYDFIPGVIEKLGATIQVRDILVRPGKPTVFATLNKKRIFGLPGNPVSSYNIFILLVRPLLKALMGVKEKNVPVSLPLGKSYTRNKSDRVAWIPVTISEGGKIYPIEYHGSAHVHSLTGADAIAGLPAGKEVFKVGDLIDVRLI